jgi:hypothetical protein
VGSNIRQYDAFLKREGVRIPRQSFLSFQKIIAIEAIRRVALKTPVDSGFLRNRWQISLSAPDGIALQQNPGISVGAAVDPVVARAVVALSTLAPFGQIWIVNPAEYATIVDQGGFVPPDPGPSSDPRPGRRGRILVSGGFSVQAPAGMVDVTVQELQTGFTPSI